MATPACFLGIDVSRTVLGLVLLASSGEVVASLRRAYAADTSELTDPQDWWRAARTAIKEILRRCHRTANQIRCVGLTGESDSIVTDVLMR